MEDDFQNSPLVQAGSNREGCVCKDCLVAATGFGLMVSALGSDLYLSPMPIPQGLDMGPKVAL